jgi:hypothetical protein
MNDHAVHRPAPVRPPRRTPGARALAASLLALLAAAAARPCPAQDAATNAPAQPAVITLTRVAYEASKTNRFQLRVEAESAGMVHITVIFPRHARDHLSAVALEVIESPEKPPLRLPIKVAVDNNGDDRSFFSTTAETLARCRLSVEIGPRFPTRNELRIETIYKMDIPEFLPGGKPPEAGGSGG